MPNSTETRLLHLINLLEALLAREAAPPMTERLDQLVEHLSQIDTTLSRAALAMRDIAHRPPLHTAAEELMSLHRQTLECLAQILDQQHQMQCQISALADLLGMPPIGSAQIGSSTSET